MRAVCEASCNQWCRDRSGGASRSQAESAQCDMAQFMAKCETYGTSTVLDQGLLICAGIF